MWARCDSTVRTLRKSCAAISAFVWPSAIRRRISTSRSLSSSGGPAGSAARRHASAELGLEIGVAGGRRADGLHELLVGGLLEHVGARAGLQRLARERGVLLHRQHHHSVAGDASRRRGIAGRLELARHVEVEDEHVGRAPRT